MKTLASLAGLFTLAALLLAPLPATATTVSDCQALITQLLFDTGNTTYSGGVGNKAEQAQAKAEADLSQASKKLDEAKFADAIDEMNQYKDAIDFALVKGFITADADTALKTEADGVIACIETIGQ